MSLLSRGARAAARSSRQLTSRQGARFDSHQAGHGESAFNVAGGPPSESFGRGFYIALAVIPLSIATYTFAASSEAPFLTSAIRAYQAREAELTRRNNLNQAAVEQAAMDRQMFTTRAQDLIGPDLQYPEQFNSSSPWNVAAGDGGADLNHLVEHYIQKEKVTEEGRQARLRDGKVTTVYDDTTGGRFPSFSGKK